MRRPEPSSVWPVAAKYSDSACCTASATAELSAAVPGEATETAAGVDGGQ